MIAFTREVSPAIGQCELTHLDRLPIDLERARAQHAAFERTLEQLGCTVRRLPPAPELPDAVFVQDTAVVLDEVAILARPGAASRRPEVESVASALDAIRPLRSIESPGTLDGGDVVCLGRRLFVGQTARTNAAAWAPGSWSAVRLRHSARPGDRVPAPAIGRDAGGGRGAPGEPRVGRSRLVWCRRGSGRRSGRAVRCQRPVRRPNSCLSDRLSGDPWDGLRPADWPWHQLTCRNWRRPKPESRVAARLIIV